jgi:pimeloyl-ACP methyl ester carboxylesterase
VSSATVANAGSRIDGLLNTRVRFAAGSAFADVRGSVTFTVPGSGAWTLLLDDGRIALRRGAVRHPSTAITVDPETMCALLEGRCSGVEAFLDGRITMRGTISLALRVDGAFDVGSRPASHPRARTTSAAGVDTFYLEAGPADAPPVILLHGLGATNASMLPLLPGLAETRRVLLPDLPGFGASAAPNWAYSISELAGWLGEFARAVGAERPALVGNSLGGRVAIEAALARPGSFPALVLLCPSPAFRRMRQLVPAVRLLSPEVGRIPFWTSHRLVVRSIRLMFARPDRLPQPWYDAAADEFCLVMSRPAHRRAFLACLRQIYVEPAYGEHGFWDRLPDLAPPALFVWGELDRLVPAGFARHVAAAVPAARSALLADCGHVPQFELPEETERLTRDFLDQAAHSRQTS